MRLTDSFTLLLLLLLHTIGGRWGECFIIQPLCIQQRYDRKGPPLKGDYCYVDLLRGSLSFFFLFIDRLSLAGVHTQTVDPRIPLSQGADSFFFLCNSTGDERVLERCRFCRGGVDEETVILTRFFPFVLPF